MDFGRSADAMGAALRALERMTFLSRHHLLALVAGAVLAGPAVAQDAENNPWVAVAGTDTVQWYGKSESGQLMHVDGKKNNAYGYVYQKEDKSRKTYSYGKVFVMLEDCKKGFGHAVYNDMEGNYTGRNTFVRFGPTIADDLASMACQSWDNESGKVSREAPEQLWETVAQAAGSGNKFLLKTDSVRQRQYNKVAAVSGLYAYQRQEKNTTEYSEYVIALKACRSGMGVIHELDFEGKLVEKSDVVLDGNSVIAGVAKSLCRKR